MASYTLKNTPFPSGTSVSAYDAEGYSSFPAGGPPGSPVATATVTAGVLTFTGLTNHHSYFAAAKVGSLWRNWLFRVGENGPPPRIPEEVDFANIDGGRLLAVKSDETGYEFIDAADPGTSADEAIVAEFEARTAADEAETEARIAADEAEAEARAAGDGDVAHPSEWGVKADGTTNDTAAWTEAFEDLAGTGRRLLMPNGVSVIKEPLPPIENFTLAGQGRYDWASITHLGSVFSLQGGLTSTSSNAFEVTASGALEGCVFYYPGESASNVTPAITATGYVIRLAHSSHREGGEVLRNVIVNAPYGISNGQAWSRIKGNRICPTKVAIHDEEQSVEHQFIENEITPGIWNPAYSGAIMPYIAQNAVAFKLAATLGTFTNNTVFGMKDGYLFEGSIGFTSINGGLIDGCRYCARFADGSKGTAIFTGVTFGSTVSATIGASRDKYATLESNCVKVERPESALSIELNGCQGDGANGDLIDVLNGSGSEAPVHLSVNGGHWENMGRFSHTYTMTVTSVTGTFTDSTTANNGDTITGGSSGATAIVRKYESGKLWLDSKSGTFTGGETITGSKSGATAKVGTVSEGPRLQFIRYEDSQEGDLVVNGVKIDMTAYLFGAGIWAVDGGTVNLNGTTFRSVRSGTSYCLQANSGVERVIESGNVSHVPEGGVVDILYSAGVKVVSGKSNWSRRPLNTATAENTTTLSGTTAELAEIIGTTEIKKIEPTYRGHRVTLKFASNPKVTKGENLKLASTFEATAEDTLTLICDGTNWLETGRSVN